MSRQAAIVCVSDQRASGLVAALAAGIHYPIAETRVADVAHSIASTQPAAVIVAEPGLDADALATIVAQVEALEGAYVPVLACLPDNSGAPSVLPIAMDGSPLRVVARLRSALRVRALHGTVQRRASDDEIAVAKPQDSNATVLVAGRGGGYPALTTAVAQRSALIGALSFETAQRYLNDRDVDGLVVGDGFSVRAVEAFVDTLGADARFRDLPLVVADSRVGALDLDLLPNADCVRGGPERVVAHLMPLAHLHAFAARLRRWVRSLDSKGLVDTDTGLLTCDAFMRDLVQAIDDRKKKTGTLSLARFSFPGLDRHASVDAARIVGRLVRDTDFACQDDDGSIHVAFGDTDLKAAHVVARRIASVLKHTMLMPDTDAPRLNPEVALVTRKPADTAETLLARVLPAIAAE
jgi:hypothetical protein